MVSILKELLMNTKDTSNINWEEYLYYDTSSPTFLRWKVQRGWRIPPGSVAGFLGKRKDGSSTGWRVEFLGKTYQAGRIVWELVKKQPLNTSMVIDHLNGDNTDNHIDNLCPKTQLHNSHNQKKRKNNVTEKSGIMVIRCKSRKYPIVRAAISFNWKKYTKSISLKDTSIEEAFAICEQWRKAKMEELNQSGAMYTDSHGKRN